MYLVYWGPFIATYQILNRYPIFEPRELPMTWVDHIIPFTPRLLPVYIGYLPFCLWTIARSRNDREVNWLFYGAHAQLLLSVPFFAFFPVRMPLELFYPPEPYSWADALWRWFDAPNNCFPSLHVSNCLLALQCNWDRPWRGPHTIVALAIIASTVLVKQHYAVDVLGGVSIYVASRWFLERLRITRLTSEGWYVGRGHPG